MSIPKIKSYEMPINLEVDNTVQWEPQSDKAVLLIHDMQQYFLDFYNQRQSPIPGLIANIQKIKQKCESLKIPIIYTAQPGNQKAEDRALLTDFWGTGLEEKEEQTSIIPQLSPSENDIMLTKWRYSAFKKSELQQLMKTWNRDQLIICGVYAHIGCLLTAADAFMYDIKPFFVKDAVADFSVEDHQMAIRYAAKRCSTITTTNQLIGQL